jgi:hypothetical protein
MKINFGLCGNGAMSLEFSGFFLNSLQRTAGQVVHEMTAILAYISWPICPCLYVLAYVAAYVAAYVSAYVSAYVDVAYIAKDKLCLLEIREQ